MADSLPVDGLCGTYPSKSDRIITSGLPTNRPEPHFAPYNFIPRSIFPAALQGGAPCMGGFDSRALDIANVQA